MRKRLREIVDPIVLRSVADREEVAKITAVFEALDDRLSELEGVLNVGKGKNVVYDRIMEICNNAEVERIQFTQTCK